MKRKHPDQIVVLDPKGTPRFCENKIVSTLLEFSRQGRTINLNLIACMDFDDADRVQFAQLIGYSVSGFSELSYVSDADYRRADRAAKRAEAADTRRQPADH